MANPEPTDDECIATTARGDTTAFGILWRRHSSAAYSVARSYRTLDADDLVAESFAKVLRAILGGGGPSVAFRAYLFTTIRNTAATQLKRATTVSIDRDIDDETSRELSVEGPDATHDTVAAEAFRTLPPRWQQVLWHVGVEGMSPVDAAPLLGLTPNGVSALALRARRGFRRKLVAVACADLPAGSVCRPALLAKIGERTDTEGYAPAQIAQHASENCAQCRGILGELGAADVSLSITIMVAAIGAGSVPALVSLGTATAVGASAASSPAALIAAPTTLAPAKLSVLAATIAALALPLSGIIGNEAETEASPTVSEVRDVGRPDPTPPTEQSEEPEPAPTPSPPSAEPPPRASPDPEPPPPAPEPVAPGLGNRAAPLFALAPGTTPSTAQIAGLGTPGWTVHAFVAEGWAAFAGPQTDPIDQAPRAEACPHPPNGEISRAYSTGPLGTAAWSLTLRDLDPGQYSVVVVECTVVDGDTIASVFSLPETFSITPPP